MSYKETEKPGLSEAPNDSEAKEEEEDDGEVFDTNWTEQVESFEELGLKEEVLRGIYGYGFEKPSQI
jgi:superfamily II DNA/RNA helicase